VGADRPGVFGMKIRMHRSTTFSRRVGVLLALGSLLAWPLLAQIRSGGQASGWKYPERYELPILAKGQTNRLKGLLMGQQGQHLSNQVYRVNQMQLEHYDLDGKTNLIARAPECLFNMDDRIAWSTGRLEIIGLAGAMRMDGNEGFEARMTNSTLTISNRVRTVLRQGLAKISNP
jgi:hypothetical protein